MWSDAQPFDDSGRLASFPPSELTLRTGDVGVTDAYASLFAPMARKRPDGEMHPVWETEIRF